MNTSHEMAQSVLKKRDGILRRRRILTASIGAAAGTAAVAAFVISLNISSLRGVDLIKDTSSDPAATRIISFDSAEKLEKYVKVNYPEAVYFEPGYSELISPLSMGVVDDCVYYQFVLASGGGTVSVEWDFTGNGAEKLSEINSANPDNSFEYAEIPGVYYSQATGERTFYWVQDDCLFYAIIPDGSGDEVVSLLAENPYYFKNTAPLALLGATTDEDGNYCVDMENWEILTDYADFRERFFGVWDDPGEIRGTSQFTLDDAENSSLFAREGTSWLRDYYRVGDDMYAFIADWGADSWLFWIDSTAPDTMYFEEMNDSVLYDHFHSGTDVLTRTDTQVDQPENGFQSVFMLREMAQKYGIDMDTLVCIEYNIGGHTVYHDTQYQSYPVYLESELQDTLTLRTKVGDVMTNDEYMVIYTLAERDGTWRRSSVRFYTLDGVSVCVFEEITERDTSPGEQGFEATGTRNVLLDTKQAGDFSVMLIGDYVSADTEEHPGMINCFKFGIRVFDGNATTNFSGAHFDVGQDGYWLYTDKLADYTNVFKFGDNYIIVLRYFNSDGSCYAVFNAIKDGEFYSELMGNYSAVTGVPIEVTTPLSETLSYDEQNRIVYDVDNGISYKFDFDAISDTYIRPHYTVTYDNIDQ